MTSLNPVDLFFDDDDDDEHPHPSTPTPLPTSKPPVMEDDEEFADFEAPPTLSPPQTTQHPIGVEHGEDGGGGGESDEDGFAEFEDAAPSNLSPNPPKPHSPQLRMDNGETGEGSGDGESDDDDFAEFEDAAPPPLPNTPPPPTKTVDPFADVMEELEIGGLDDAPLPEIGNNEPQPSERPGSEVDRGDGGDGGGGEDGGRGESGGSGGEEGGKGEGEGLEVKSAEVAEGGGSSGGRMEGGEVGDGEEEEEGEEWAEFEDGGEEKGEKEGGGEEEEWAAFEGPAEVDSGREVEGMERGGGEEMKAEKDEREGVEVEGKRRMGMEENVEEQEEEEGEEEWAAFEGPTEVDERVDAKKEEAERTTSEADGREEVDVDVEGEVVVDGEKEEKEVGMEERESEDGEVEKEVVMEEDEEEEEEEEWADFEETEKEGGGGEDASQPAPTQSTPPTKSRGIPERVCMFGKEGEESKGVDWESFVAWFVELTAECPEECRIELGEHSGVLMEGWEEFERVMEEEGTSTKSTVAEAYMSMVGAGALACLFLGPEDGKTVGVAGKIAVSCCEAAKKVIGSAGRRLLERAGDRTAPWRIRHEEGVVKELGEQLASVVTAVGVAARAIGALLNVSRISGKRVVLEAWTALGKASNVFRIRVTEALERIISPCASIATTSPLQRAIHIVMDPCSSTLQVLHHLTNAIDAEVNGVVEIHDDVDVGAVFEWAPWIAVRRAMRGDTSATEFLLRLWSATTTPQTSYPPIPILSTTSPKPSAAAALDDPFADILDDGAASSSSTLTPTTSTSPSTKRIAIPEWLQGKLGGDEAGIVGARALAAAWSVDATDATLQQSGLCMLTAGPSLPPALFPNSLPPATLRGLTALAGSRVPLADLLVSPAAYHLIQHFTPRPQSSFHRHPLTFLTQVLHQGE